MAHATHMAAMNAARKLFGKDWKATAHLEKVDGQWYIQLIEKEATPEQREANIEANDEFLAKPAPSIPALPAALTAPVTPDPAPALPVLPAFLAQAPQAPAEVPEFKADEEVNSDNNIAFMESQESSPDFAALNAAADAQANAAAVNDVTPLRPRISTTEKPTKKVWVIADSMPGAKRKEVIEACVAQGIAYGTARTQYQHWFKCMADQKVAPLAVIGADGAITIINQGESAK